jgi:hypothetical protein
MAALAAPVQEGKFCGRGGRSWGGKGEAPTQLQLTRSLAKRLGGAVGTTKLSGTRIRPQRYRKAEDRSMGRALMLLLSLLWTLACIPGRGCVPNTCAGD